MRAIENNISEKSKYFVYTPSPTARELFFYPICAGYYEYLPHYCMMRSAYDSLLFMEIVSGECLIHGEQKDYIAKAGQLVIIDCYRKHGYETSIGWNARWIHIDGAKIRSYFELISSKKPATRLNIEGLTPEIGLDNVFITGHTKGFDELYFQCYEALSKGAVKEHLLSTAITQLLCNLIENLDKSSPAEKNEETISKIISYINQNFINDISLNELAGMAHLSTFYFSRMFKRYTGYTPYEYVLNTRLAHSKYLLKTTSLSVKEICFASGFLSESRFCIAFQEKEGMSPSSYRQAL